MLHQLRHRGIIREEDVIPVFSCCDLEPSDAAQVIYVFDKTYSWSRQQLIAIGHGTGFEEQQRLKQFLIALKDYKQWDTAFLIDIMHGFPIDDDVLAEMISICSSS